MGSPPVVVIGASAGGIEALQRLLPAIPPDFPAAIMVVLHLNVRRPSLLAPVLARATRLPVRDVDEPESYAAGHVYLAPPDRHLVIDDGLLRCDDGPRENLHRPSVDVLFRSASRHGPRAVGVVLSGALDDGAIGLLAIRRAGGGTAIQDPIDAAFPDMPQSAQRMLEPDVCLPAEDLGSALIGLAEKAARAEVVPWTGSRLGTSAIETVTCPECEAAVIEEVSGPAVSYRCPASHRFSVNSMIAGNNDALERALWAAVRAMSDSAALAKRVSQRAAESGRDEIAERFRRRSEQQRKHIEIIRAMLIAERQQEPGVTDR